MNTIKFESRDSTYPLQKGTDRERHAKSIALYEGDRIWHRPFEVKNLEEFKKWKKDHGWGAQHVTSYVAGYDPIDSKGEHPIYFEYLTFYDTKGEFYKCIVFCCNVFIMNASGQTIDSFAA